MPSCPKPAETGKSPDLGAQLQRLKHAGCRGSQPSPGSAIQRGLKVLLWMDVCVFRHAAEGGLVLSAFVSLPGAVPSLNKNKSNPGSGELQPLEQCPSRRAGVGLPVFGLNWWFTCFCLSGSLASAGRTGWACVQCILQPGGWVMHSGWGARCPHLPNLRYVHLV